MKIHTIKIKNVIGFRIQKHIDDSYIPIDIIKTVSHSTCKMPPRKQLEPEIDTSLSEVKKTETNPLVFKQKLAKFIYSK